ncbi:MAG: alkaline phosphatase family protein, partial [Alphaproteobacteria bacterium]
MACRSSSRAFAYLLFALSLAAQMPARAAESTTPIKHVVVLVIENRSFDHYFGAYPNAA